MKFMIIVHSGNRKMLEEGKLPENLREMMQEMGRFNEKLMKAGIIQDAAGLQPSTKGARVHFPGKGKAPVVTPQGPFADSLISGFWVWDVKSKEEAIEWARQAPMEDGATLEIRKFAELSDYGL